jgi:hypothetical protein
VYSIVEDEKNIAHYRNIFLEVMRKKTEMFPNCNVGHKGKGDKYDIYWSTKSEYWMATKIIEDKRYWNAFGLTNPTKKSLSIIVEICFPLNHIDRRVGGAFAEDGTDKVIVVHRGIITRGEKTGTSGGKELFWNNYKGECINVTDKDRTSRLVLIGELLSPDFPSRVKDFIVEVERIKKIAKGKQNEKHFVNKKEQQASQKPISAILIKKPISETSTGIAQRIRKIILKINEICESNKRKPIFNESDLFKLWGNIENSCTSENEYKNFAETLYRVLKETTRYKNPNYKTKDDRFYIFRLPEGFIKNNPTTTYFIFIVNAFRHYYVHGETGKIADVYEELLGRRSGPDLSEDYEKLQIEVLKQFETSMNILLEMVKNDLNRPQNH